jgi:hypothetical protein
MDARSLPAAVLAAAGDRRGGAMEVAATALDGLLEVAGDPPRLEAAVAALEAGQPAMAPIWHLAAAARAPDPAAALTALRERLTADADAAVAAATAWLRRHLAAHPGQVATVSHSSLAARVLARVADRRRRGAGWSTAPGAGGSSASTDPAGAVVGLVGADAIGPRSFLNAAGTRELAARVPTLVVATGVKLVPGEVFGRMGGPGFEVVELAAVRAVVVGAEVLSPAEAGRRAGAVSPGRP